MAKQYERAQEDLRAAFESLPDKELRGFESPIGHDELKLTYWILGSFFLRVADRRAMAPVQLIAADGTTQIETPSPRRV